MPGPLAGITIVEFAGLGPGPFCGMMLADMGARVIRIDRMPSPQEAQSDIFKRSDPFLDRGRQSICLDLKSEAGKETALRLIAKADALFEGFRPGVMEKLGLGPDVCIHRNPRLVYARMTGWGQTGPLAHVAGHDINYIAITGALHAMGAKALPPAVPLNLLGDFAGGGMMLAFGITCALLEAKRSGQGQVIDAAMSDGTVTIMAMIYGLYQRRLWSNARESNFLDGAAPYYATYECADGRYVAVGPLEPQFYRELLTRCEIDDPQFAEQWQTGDWPEMKEKLAAVFKQRTRDEWCARFEGSDACLSPVLDLDEAPHHPHNVARQTFQNIDGVFHPAPSPRFSRTPGEIRASDPPSPQQTADILTWAGLSRNELNDLVQRRVVQ